MAGIIQHLNKSFGEKVIFSDFSFTFKDAGIYALVGESGAGKTTLLRLIGGLDKSYDGDVEGFGTVSYAFQEYRLFNNLNALQNVYELSFSENTEDAKRSAAACLLSLGFKESELYLMPRELSGGMKQRVSLARAILYPADTYLFDEPLKELDPILASVVIAKLQELAREHTVIVTVHSEEECKSLGATLIEVSR